MAYLAYGFKLTEVQIKKIRKAHDLGLGTTIKISKGNISGTEKLFLTQSQVNKIDKARGAGQGVTLKLSKAQLSHMEKVGGFIPLLAAIPAILGAMGGLAGGVASAVNSSRQTNEQKRHNGELEKIARGGALYPETKALFSKMGIGGCTDSFYAKKIGNGLYLEPQGSGLFFSRTTK